MWQASNAWILLFCHVKTRFYLRIFPTCSFSPITRRIIFRWTVFDHSDLRSSSGRFHQTLWATSKAVANNIWRKTSYKFINVMSALNLCSLVPYLFAIYKMVCAKRHLKVHAKILTKSTSGVVVVTTLTYNYEDLQVQLWENLFCSIFKHLTFPDKFILNGDFL